MFDGGRTNIHQEEALDLAFISKILSNALIGCIQSAILPLFTKTVLVRLSNITSFYQRQSQSMYSTVNTLTDLIKLKDDLKLKKNFALLVQKYFMLATCNFKKSVSLFLCFYLMLMKTRNQLCCRLLHKRSFSDHQKVVHQDHSLLASCVLQ